MTQDDARTIMMYDAHKKSAVLAYLLWWFLGTLGAHRFYLGKVGSGVAMLCITLVSIPAAFVLIGFLGFAVIGLWWLVDAFLIAGIVRDHNLALADRLAR